jgi:hypothetical protein
MRSRSGFGIVLLSAWVVCGRLTALEMGSDPTSAALLDELKACPCGILYESYRDRAWKLCRINADGSNPVCLTQSPGTNEMYPHASPDGKKICFLADEKEGTCTTRNVYVMNLDGTDRTLVARNGREPCWSADGSAIVYLGPDHTRADGKDGVARGLVFYDLKTRQAKEHPNKGLHGLYAICSSPDGNWVLSSVHGAMGFGHAIIAIDANGSGVVDLHLKGCRPDVRADGKLLANGSTDLSLAISDLDLKGPKPRATKQRAILTSVKPNWVYHIDWSPDGRYVAFSRGPKAQTKSLVRAAPESVGMPAPGWNICVGDPTRKNRWVAITTDGNSNKEPDWIPALRKGQ